MVAVLLQTLLLTHVAMSSSLPMAALTVAAEIRIHSTLSLASRQETEHLP